MFLGANQPINAEKFGDAVSALDFAHQNPPSAGGQGAGERACDRGLASATLAADNVQSMSWRRHFTPVI
jgi:hypothetical protein